MKILIVEENPGEHHAIVVGKTCQFPGTGQTEAEALGNLIILNSQEFGVEVLFDRIEAPLHPTNKVTEEDIMSLF
jgi:hypothetical protein